MTSMHGPIHAGVPDSLVALDVERHVLSALLLGGSEAGEVLSILPNPEAFSDERHRHIYGVLSSMLGKGWHSDPVALEQAFRDHGLLDPKGGPSYVDTLVGRTLGSAFVRDHARIVAEKFKRRQIAAALDDAGYSLRTNHDVDAAYIVALTQRALAAIDRGGCTPAESAQLTRLSDVASEPVEWLWPNRVAVGKLTLIAGDPGVGKSFLMLYMAARVSRGESLPGSGGHARPPGGVLLLNAEDNAADTIRPRLDAAGADAARIEMLSAVQLARAAGGEALRTFNLARDLALLEDAIRRVEGCSLVIIDPVTAYLGGIDSHKNADVREVLAPLGTIAARCRVAVVAVTHLNKSNAGPAIYRATGSLAFTAAARTAWLVTKCDKDPTRRRLMLPMKSNCGPNEGGLAFELVAVAGHVQPTLKWDPNPVHTSADDALSSAPDGSPRRTEIHDAMEWLREMLANGPRSATEMERCAKEAGHSASTLKRAKERLGVESFRRGKAGGWEWAIVPPEAARRSVKKAKARRQGAHVTGGEPLGEKPVKNSMKQPKGLTAKVVSPLGERLEADPGHLAIDATKLTAASVEP